MFGDAEPGDYTFIAIWASLSAAEAATDVVMPVMTPALADAQATGRARRIFEVLEPRS